MILFFNSNVDINIQKNCFLKDIDKQLNLHKSKLKSQLQCLKTLNDAIQSSDDIDNPTKITRLLKELKSNLDNLRTNISELEHLKDLLVSNELEDFNSKVESIQNNIYSVSLSIEKFMVHYTKNLQYPVQATPKPIVEIENTDVSTQISNTDLADSDILLISEMQNKIVLPYLISDLEKKLKEKPNYSSLQDVINKEYTFKLSKFKNATISRFKEAYNLMRKKEKASVVDSLDLALELSFNNLLNPAIILACKNLDELDIYLDCLSSNELDKFSFFKVKYEIAPMKKT